MVRGQGGFLYHAVLSSRLKYSIIGVRIQGSKGAMCMGCVVAAGNVYARAHLDYCVLYVT